MITSEYYYRETNDEVFLQTLHAKAFCEDCYGKYGDKLLDGGFLKKIIHNEKICKRETDSKKLDEF